MIKLIPAPLDLFTPLEMPRMIDIRRHSLDVPRVLDAFTTTRTASTLHHLDYHLVITSAARLHSLGGVLAKRAKTATSRLSSEDIRRHCYTVLEDISAPLDVRAAGW